MITLNAVTCGPDYTDATTIGPIFNSNGGFFIITLHDVYVQIAYGTQGLWQWMTETHFVPGSGVLNPGTIAVRFRNHKGGNAVVTAALTSAQEAPPLVTASGS